MTLIIPWGQHLKSRILVFLIFWWEFIFSSSIGVKFAIVELQFEKPESGLKDEKGQHWPIRRKVSELSLKNPYFG